MDLLKDILNSNLMDNGVVELKPDQVIYVEGNSNPISTSMLADTYGGIDTPEFQKAVQDLCRGKDIVTFDTDASGNVIESTGQGLKGVEGEVVFDATAFDEASELSSEEQEKLTTDEQMKDKVDETATQDEAKPTTDGIPAAVASGVVSENITTTLNGVLDDVFENDQTITTEELDNIASSLKESNNYLTNSFNLFTGSPFPEMDPIGTIYVAGFKNAIQEMMNVTMQSTNILAEFSAKILEGEKNDENLIPDGLKPGNGGPGGSGGGGAGGGGAGGGGAGGAGDVTPPTTSADKIVDILKSMNLNNLSNGIGKIINTASSSNISLDKVLSDETYAEKIKLAMLNSSGLSDADKKLIQEMDSKLLQIKLKDILTGKEASVFAIDASNTNIIKNFLTRIAEGQNITVDQLVSSSSNGTLLTNSLKDMNAILTHMKRYETMNAADVQMDMREIYEGGSIANLTVSSTDTLRSVLDEIARSTNKTVEQVFENPSNAEALKTSALNFGKTSVLIDAISNGDLKMQQDTITTIIK